MTTSKCECETGERTPLNCWRCTRHNRPTIDQDDLERASLDLMHRHEATTLRMSDKQPDGSVLLVLDTGQVYEYRPSGEATLTDIRMFLPITDIDGVQYVPFVRMELGTVGYAVVYDDEHDPHRHITFLYFNPSDHRDDNDVPNVFVYHGHTADPAYDQSRTHYVVWPEEPR